jgi:hypothetical protein
MSGDEDDDQGERDWSQRPTRKIPGDTVQDMGGREERERGSAARLAAAEEGRPQRSKLGRCGCGLTCSRTSRARATLISNLDRYHTSITGAGTCCMMENWRSGEQTGRTGGLFSLHNLHHHRPLRIRTDARGTRKKRHQKKDLALALACLTLPDLVVLLARRDVAVVKLHQLHQQGTNRRENGQPPGEPTCPSTVGRLMCVIPLRPSTDEGRARSRSLAWPCPSRQHARQGCNSRMPSLSSPRQQPFSTVSSGAALVLWTAHHSIWQGAGNWSQEAM